MTTKAETAKKTATKTKKAATKAKTTAKKTATTKATETSSQVEEVAVKAQDRYFSVLEQGQAVALDGFETIVETVNKVGTKVSTTINERVDLPAIPAFDALPARMPKIEVPENLPNKLVDGYFEFANKALANQREFADKALAISTKGSASKDD